MNKSLPRCALVLSSLAATLPSASRTHAQTVANPGFDSGSLSGWTYSASGVAYSATGGRNTAPCVLFGAGFSTHASIFQTVNGLQPNTRYKFVGYAYLGSAGGKATLTAQNDGGTPVSAVVTSTISYQRLEVDFTTGASNTSAALFFGNNSTSTVYADDFSVSPVAFPLTDPQNLAGRKPNDDLSDEFNATAVDKGKWQTLMDSWTGNSPFQFDASNTTLSGGVAHLVAINESKLPNGNCRRGGLRRMAVLRCGRGGSRVSPLMMLSVSQPVIVRRLSLPALLAGFMLPLYVLDQVSKWLVVRHIGPEEPWVVVPDWFSLVHWRNTGAAFSVLTHSNGFFLGLSSVALVVLGVLYRRGAFEGAWARAGFCLLVPGVLGNLTDRLARGSVVDFLLFDLHVPGARPWPAFNVADSCICVAVGCFLVGSWREMQREERGKPEF